LNVVFACDDEPFNIPGTILAVMRARPGHVYHVFPLAGHASARHVIVNTRRYLALYGPAGFLAKGVRLAARRIAAALGVTRGGPYSLEQAAGMAGAAVHRVRSLNTRESRALLSGLSPDLLISLACPEILRRRTLAIPSRAALNVHSALLPRNRGMLPTFWSLMESPPRPGVTVHLMNERLDDGEILLQRAIPVERGRTTLEALLAESKRVAADLLVEAIDAYDKGAPATFPNPASEATVNTFPTGRDVREFRRRGWRVR
jgi:methionyl-tRNA formyltransferase